MEKQNNSGWYVLGGLALLCVIGYNMGKSRQTPSTPVISTEPDAAPDTAISTEIIITPGK